MARSARHTPRRRSPGAVSVRDKVANRVRTLRFLQREMTQEDLANRVGVARQTIIAIEKGKYNPSVALAIKIARVFGVTVEEVFMLNGDQADQRKGRAPGAKA
jgi:putative transcriptional regulator